MRRLWMVPAVLVLLVPAGLAGAAVSPGGTFIDDDRNTHEGNIEAVAAQGVTLGCVRGVFYCPSDRVSRGQMASFLARAFDLPAATRDFFPDDNGSVHEPNINRIAQAGITLGYPDGTYDPNGHVSRAQMASFVARAMGLTPIPGDRFTDVNGIHEPNINAIAAAGVTLGCSPDGTRYCPHDLVRRDQMASFIARARGLTPLTVPPRPTEPYGRHMSLLDGPGLILTCEPDTYCSGHLAWIAGEPFYIEEGFIQDNPDPTDLAAFSDPSLHFSLTIDGRPVPMVVDLDTTNPSQWTKHFRFVFPNGLVGGEVQSHRLEGQWWGDGALLYVVDIWVMFKD
jgi:hypothetical protein